MYDTGRSTGRGGPTAGRAGTVLEDSPGHCETLRPVVTQRRRTKSNVIIGGPGKRALANTPGEGGAAMREQSLKGNVRLGHRLRRTESTGQV